VLLQVALGIGATLNAGQADAFRLLAVAHQLGAVVLLLTLVTVARLSTEARGEDAARPSTTASAGRLPARV
jgi:heme A synthase